eukprot:CAMPEP_0181192562 /NCGR_PEP_ID=MMETSP1096-20121128/13348_1 /TAXON_ID=156174 ORGANISM="Chrysochromulina ericina, Strain CCMP281" /NCGR_SAMPLE_ID=MMETSP1096 /ASSEMBLY_ACC=CAM_ASM_000453 /LENGTH=57 /DNA_ID=CAMNT_0023281963 /DNA_START=1073 /DNA_END=1243 /DNA_ORIENTATION=+
MGGDAHPCGDLHASRSLEGQHTIGPRFNVTHLCVVILMLPPGGIRVDAARHRNATPP